MSSVSSVFDIGESDNREQLAKDRPPEGIDCTPGADHVVKVLPEIGEIVAWFAQGDSAGTLVRIVRPDRYVSVVRLASASHSDPFAVYSRDLVTGLSGLI